MGTHTRFLGEIGVSALYLQFFLIIIKYFQDALWQLKVGDTASTSKQAAVTLCAVGHVPWENKQFSQL